MAERQEWILKYWKKGDRHPFKLVLTPKKHVDAYEKRLDADPLIEKYEILGPKKD